MINMGTYANIDNQFLQAAIYCRLSKEDEKKGESASIETQKDMLTDFVERKGWNLYKTYVDDGFSGLHSSSRLAFQEMLRDAEERKFDILITKDLSRLGRNYIETGTYIENFFPKHGIRYIALNDGVDILHDDNEIIPFKNVLNEFYSRDVSKKVSSRYMTRTKQGKFTGCLAPFGYMKDPDNPHILVPDPDTVEIITGIKNPINIHIKHWKRFFLSRILSNLKS